MSKTITIHHNGESSDVEISSSIKREAIYGKTQTVVEIDGKTLKRGTLTQNGELFTRQQLDYVKTDEKGSPSEKPELLAEDTVEKQEASFKRGLTLTQGSIIDVLEQPMDSYYHLEGIKLEPGIFKTDFNFRAGIPSPALLIVREDGNAFLLITNERLSTWIGETQAYEFFDAENNDEEEEEEDTISFSF